MSVEKFVSGYCRQTDAARMVEVVIDRGQMEEADCRYGDCPFQTQCPIAAAIDELLSE